jgi:tRNA1Val (adenine37-N6)-methyltransferase
MPNDYFQFQQFRVEQAQAAMKVTTDACIFGAWIARLLAEKKGRLLDVGTGTGLLSLMIAQETALQVDAVEIDSGAAAQAQSNFRISPWNERLSVWQGDIREFRKEQRYDYIISNPPFYEHDLTSEDERRNDALHSRRLKLHELVEVLGELLREEGQWGVVLPTHRVSDLLGLAAAKGWKCLQRLEVFNEGKATAFRSCLWLGREGTVLPTEQLRIRQSGIYTLEFQQLLGSFYLAFQPIDP